MTWMDTSLDQLLDMTIPCLSVQMQSFSIFTIEPAESTFMASLYFSTDLLFRFFEHDMIGNFNGTISNMN